MDYLLIYLITINALGLLLMLTDKQNARKKNWRIPEITLLGISVFGGSLGVFIGIYAAHHKIRKPAFYIGVPVIFLIEVIALAIWITKSDTFL